MNFFWFLELVYVRLDNPKMSENPIFQGSILRKDKIYVVICDA